MILKKVVKTCGGHKVSILVRVGEIAEIFPHIRVHSIRFELYAFNGRHFAIFAIRTIKILKVSKVFFFVKIDLIKPFPNFRRRLIFE